MRKVAAFSCALVGASALSGGTPSMVAGNEAGGVIRIQGMFNGQAKGMQAADAECKKYGKLAKYEGVNEWRGTLRYECVKPS